MRPIRPSKLGISVLAGALVGTVARSLSNVAWLAVGNDVARIRDDLESFVALRRLAAAFGIEILRWAPTALSHPMRTFGSVESLQLGSLAVLTDAGISLTPAVLAAGVVAFVGRLRPGVLPGPAAALSAALFFLPFLYAPVRRFSPGLLPFEAPNFMVWLASSVLAMMATAAVCRRFPVPAAPARIAAGSAATLVALAGTAVSLAAIDPEVQRDPDRGGRPPNVLLVSIDSLRADHVGCYGYPDPTTPTLDRLAREGARFARATAPTSWTLPSHLALLTGLPVESSADQPSDLRARPSVKTLAEVLRAAGYKTAGFVGGPYLESRYGFAQGFSTYDDFTVVARSNAESHRGSTSPELLHLAEGWLAGWRESDSDRPFFLFLHLWDVHFDYVPPPPWDRMFDPDYDGTVDGTDFLGNPKVHKGMDPRDLRHVIALYDGEIAFTDHHVGMLIERLDRWGVLDDTLVVVTADHGDEFFEHGVKGHRKTLYETSLAVPLVFRWPSRVPAGAVVEPPVGLHDVAPTILALAGLTPPPAFARVPGLGEPVARDLSPLLSETDPSRLEWWRRRPLFADLHGTMGAVRMHSRKLIAHVDEAGPMREAELYDLDTDPGETRDLRPERSAEAAALLDRLNEWRNARDAGSFAGAVPASREHLETLRSLGYLE